MSKSDVDTPKLNEKSLSEAIAATGASLKDASAGTGPGTTEGAQCTYGRTCECPASRIFLCMTWQNLDVTTLTRNFNLVWQMQVA